jgi:hypothetical protein
MELALAFKRGSKLLQNEGVARRLAGLEATA